MHILRRSLHLITRSLHRIHPSIPVVKSWPGTARIRAGVYRRLIGPWYEVMAWRFAMFHRARLEDTIFIGVTGSAGKTMTKFFMSEVLATRYKGRAMRGTRNNLRSAVNSLIQHASRGDNFHIVELSAFPLGVLEQQLSLVRPRIGVVTIIGTDHYSAFGSMDAIAAEKGRLIRALPPDGVAVLNADDARVLAMREGFAGRVITYGLSAGASVFASNVSSAWPDPLSFDVTYQGQTVRVQTQLFGTQWVGSALAAIAAGIVFEVSLQDAAQAIAKLRPNPGRMSPEFHPDGVVFLRDDWKASDITVAPALEFLRTARAKRKIAVIGTLSDTVGTWGKVYTDAARHALEVADTVCFVGAGAFVALRAKPTDQPERLRAFSTANAAHQFLSAFLEPGDLVLLKGSTTADHLYRLALTRISPVACWKMDCKRATYCNLCELVNVPSESQAASSALPVSSSTDAPASSEPTTSMMRIESGETPTIFVGLGNPGADYENTPHNVGHAVLDRLAIALATEWQSESDANIARAEWQGRVVWLVKPKTWINHSGRALRDLASRAGFQLQQCVLVYDDLNLPLGSVRTRMRGSDGGHRGIRSILETFQTDQIRRVKVGVKRPGDEGSAKDAVLRAFTGTEMESVDSAVEQAHKHLSDFLTLTKRPQ